MNVAIGNVHHLGGSVVVSDPAIPGLSVTIAHDQAYDLDDPTMASVVKRYPDYFDIPAPPKPKRGRPKKTTTTEGQSE